MMTNDVASHNRDASTRAVKARNKVQAVRRDIKQDAKRDAEHVAHVEQDPEAVGAHVP